MRYLGLMTCVMTQWVAVECWGQNASPMEPLGDEAALKAARECADILLQFGRDDYGERKTPLFAAQLNAETRRIPAGTPEDPGVWNGHLEVAGYQPYCQDLLGDLSLLDLLHALTAVTGDGKYEEARRAYLAHALEHTRDPRSGYIPWGEHVGYDLIHDSIHEGDIKPWHEVKCFNIPWDQFWEVNPDATRHEIEVAFRNHICDEAKFAFNRHAKMDGQPNGPETESCSLLSSGGTYIDAWCWLYKKTGEKKFLEWARKMNAMYWNRRSPTTGLVPTDEHARKDYMVYAEAAVYAPYLFVAGQILGDEGAEFREQAMAYLDAYDRLTYVAQRSDGKGAGYFDAINIVTGKPAVINGTEARDGEAWLEPWQWIDNHAHPGSVVSSLAMGYSLTGDERLRPMFDRAITAMDITGSIARQTRMLSGDVAGVITSLVHVAARSRDPKYLDVAGGLVAYVLEHNRCNGLFTAGKAGAERYYCTRAGSGALATAVLSYALATHGLWDLIPPIRDIEGGLRF